MARIENQRYIETKRTDSPSFWMGKLVLGSETGIAFAELENQIAFNLASDPPEIIKTIDVSTNPETDFLELSYDMEGEDEEFVLSMISGLSLQALKASGLDIEDLTYRAGRLVRGEQYSIDREWDESADLSDIRYSADDNLYLVFSEVRDMMAEYSAY